MEGGTREAHPLTRRQLRRAVRRLGDQLDRQLALQPPPPVRAYRPLTERERELYFVKRQLGHRAIDALGQALYLRSDR